MGNPTSAIRYPQHQNNISSVQRQVRPCPSLPSSLTKFAAAKHLPIVPENASDIANEASGPYPRTVQPMAFHQGHRADGSVDQRQSRIVSRVPENRCLAADLDVSEGDGYLLNPLSLSMADKPGKQEAGKDDLSTYDA
uniref:Uncharacterized protein n=1 Tax=Steinernema glaseri TaxID=37863 RepID=A0A1I8A804_9BILA